MWMLLLFFFKQKTAYEMRISDWSSDVCSSDLDAAALDDRHDIVDDEIARERIGLNLEFGFDRQRFGLFQILRELREVDRRAVPADDAGGAYHQLVLFGIDVARVFVRNRQVDLHRVGLDRDGDDEHEIGSESCRERGCT